MRILNLSEGTKMICLPRKDIIIRHGQLSGEFECSPSVYQKLVTSPDYQNLYRFVLTPDEKKLATLYPTIEGVIITMEEAKVLSDRIMSGLDPYPTPKIDINGEETKLPDPELKYDQMVIKLKDVKNKSIKNNLINPAKLPVEVKSSDESIVKIGEDGSITATGKKGKATVTAEFKGSEEYNPAKAEFSVNVK